MTLDEAIKDMETIAEENQRVVDTKDVTIDMLFCDDEDIEERLEKYQKAAENYRQLAGWLKDYKRLLEQEPCEDTISRQAVIDKMKERDEEVSCLTTKDVRDLPTVNPQPKWIPVSERLPEKNGKHNTFLVTDSDGNLSLSKFYLPLSNSGIDQPYWSGMINVVAWMPLPEPYEPQESEE